MSNHNETEQNGGWDSCMTQTLIFNLFAAANNPNAPTAAEVEITQTASAAQTASCGN